MKPFSVNRRSWHYRMISKFSSNMPTDVCSYARALLFNLFMFAFAGCLIAVCLAAVVIMFCTILQMTWSLLTFLFAHSQFTTDAMMGAILWVIIGVVTCVILWKRWARPAQTDYEEDEKSPGFITLWYRSVRDKTCSRIEYF